MPPPAAPLKTTTPVELAALVLSTLGLAPMALEPAQAKGCQAPMQGRYAVMAMGTVGATGSGSASPSARLMEERWLPNGAVEGRIVERVGAELRTGSYRGRVSLVGTCLVQVSRQLPWGEQRSEAVLDGLGRPLYSLDRSSGSVITGRWLPMAPGACKVADLNGVVLSSQVGVSAEKGGWTPNAVVQREEWSDGQVRGVALSSYGGIGETAGYTGRLQMDPRSCWGTLQERDARGVTYNYRTLVVNGRGSARGYLYLQRDPDDLTVGWLVRD